MKQIFKNKKDQDFFEKEGYIVIKTLDDKEIIDLKSYYESLYLKDENGFGFHGTINLKDKELCKEIQTKIWNITLPKMDDYLVNYKSFVACFLVKENNSKGVVYAHQDWTFVEEPKGFCSITCWTALVDTTLDNGCMGVIKGSSNFIQNNRPSPSPQTPLPLTNHMLSLLPYLKTLEMKAGETLFFDNRTFHASPPNTTNEIRLSVGVGITQKDAEFIHYYLKPDGNKNTILKYKVDEDFYLKYDNSRLSKMYDNGELITDYDMIEEVNCSFDLFLTEDLTNLIKKSGNEYNSPFWEKQAILFNHDIIGDKKDEFLEFERLQEKILIGDSKQLEWIDNRTFFEKYTLMNILREIKFRITGK